jgi:hypothetical protein
MAVHKATRSKSSAQPQPKPARPCPDPQLKSKLFETLRHLNRGYGVALAAFDRLQRQDRLQKPAIFPHECLLDYRDRTEALRALANRDLLRFFAGREEQEALRFERRDAQQKRRQQPSTH